MYTLFKNKLIYIVLLVLFATFSNPHSAYACYCGGYNSIELLENNINESQSIFLGKVLSIKEGEFSSQNAIEDVKVVFSVSKVWKGNQYKHLIVETPPDTAAICGYPFLLGGEYIVFAYDDGNSNLSTSICTLTTSVEIDSSWVNENIIKKLGNGSLPILENPEITNFDLIQVSFDKKANENISNENTIIIFSSLILVAIIGIKVFQWLKESK